MELSRLIAEIKGDSVYLRVRDAAKKVVASDSFKLLKKILGSVGFMLAVVLFFEIAEFAVFNSKIGIDNKIKFFNALQNEFAFFKGGLFAPLFAALTDSVKLSVLCRVLLAVLWLISLLLVWGLCLKTDMVKTYADTPLKRNLVRALSAAALFLYTSEYVTAYFNIVNVQLSILFTLLMIWLNFGGKRRIAIPVLCFLAQLLDFNFSFTSFFIYITVAACDLCFSKRKDKGFGFAMLVVSCMVVVATVAAVLRGNDGILGIFAAVPYAEGFSCIAPYFYYMNNLLIAVFVYCVIYTLHRLRGADGEDYRLKIAALWIYLVVLAVINGLPIFRRSSFQTFFNHWLIISYLLSAVYLFRCFSANAEQHYAFFKSNFKKIITTYLVVEAIKYLSMVFFAGEYSPFCMTPYYLDYFNFGLIQRGLVGTVFYIITGGHLGKIGFMLLAGGLYLFSALAVLWILLSIVRKQEDTVKKAGLFVVAVYALSPTFTSNFDYINVYRVDIYMLLLTMLCVYVLYKNNRLVWLVPLVCMTCVFIHQIYAAIMYPMVFIMLCYRCFIDSEGKAKRNITVLVLSLLLVAFWFAYFMFVSSGNVIIDRDTAVDLINSRSGGFFIPNEELLDGVVFADIASHIGQFSVQIKGSQRIRTIGLYVRLLPLWAMYIYAFKKSADYDDNRLHKLAYWVACISPLTIIVCYVLEIDYGRWNAYTMTTAMVITLMLTCMQRGDKRWYKALNRIQITAWLLITALLLVGTEKFNCWYTIGDKF